MGSPMKTKILAAIICLALLLPASKAYSDDSIVADFGKSVKPIKTNKIEMESEEVILKLEDFQKDEWSENKMRRALATCSFVFKNDTPETITATVGFPIDMNNNEYFYTIPIANFKAKVNGENINSKIKRGFINEDKKSLGTWFTWQMTFSSNSTTTVVNTYDYILHAPSGYEPFFLTYILETGSNWHKVIQKAKIKIIYKDEYDLIKRVVSIKPEGWKRNRNQIIWQFENFKPTRGHDIEIGERNLWPSSKEEKDRIPLLFNKSFDNWVGPEEIIVGTLGSKNDWSQFGIDYWTDNFPKYFDITSDGKIVIADPIHESLLFYSYSDRIHPKFFVGPPLHLEWHSQPRVVISNGSKCAVVGNADMTITFSAYDGGLLGLAPNMGGADYVNEDCSKIYVGKEKGWFQYVSDKPLLSYDSYQIGFGVWNWRAYTPNGSVIQTFNSRPLELGVWELKTIKVKGEKKFQITVNFPDTSYPEKITSWVIVAKKVFSDYKRDKKGNLYGLSAGSDYGGEVARYNNKGREVANLKLPKDKLKRISSPDIPKNEVYTEIIEQYGSPVLDSQGNVYCWMRTPTHYKILKWTWKD